MAEALGKNGYVRMLLSMMLAALMMVAPVMMAEITMMMVVVALKVVVMVAEIKMMMLVVRVVVITELRTLWQAVQNWPNIPAQALSAPRRVPMYVIARTQS